LQAAITLLAAILDRAVVAVQAQLAQMPHLQFLGMAVLVRLAASMALQLLMQAVAVVAV